MRAKRQLLTIGHSYCVGLNRRLADEIARAGSPVWETAVVAPSFFQGDLRPVPLETFAGETSWLEPVDVHCSRFPQMFFYGIRLRELLHRRWDLIHCWEEPYVVAGWQVATWAPRQTPVVFFTFQNIRKNYPPPFQWIERYCIRRSRGWIAAGASVVEALLDQGYDARPHRVIPLGVDLARFYPSRSKRQTALQELGWEADGPPVIGYLGRFVPEKGLALLTATLDSIRSPWRALFVGAGPLEGSLRCWAQKQAQRVRVVTQVRHDDVPKYLNAMDLLCAPSQTTRRWREQFGRMVIEAFGCGVPVIASDSGEIPNVVGDAGVIVGENDAAGWIEAVGTLVDDACRRVEMSHKGLERAANTYSWPVVARRHLEFFNELADARDT